MIPAELMEAIENETFSAEVNVTSGSPAFFKRLRVHPLIVSLQTQMQRGSQIPESIVARIRELSGLQIDPEYENPRDAALAAYLIVLEDSRWSKEAALLASRAQNCWWSAQYSARMIAIDHLRSLANSSLSGKSARQPETFTPLGANEEHALEEIQLGSYAQKFAISPQAVFETAQAHKRNHKMRRTAATRTRRVKSYGEAAA